MNRRDFIQQASAGTLAFSLPDFPAFAKDARMGIVVHSYAFRWNSKITSTKYPGFTDAIALLEHCHQIGAGGLQVVVNGWTSDFAGKVREKREKLGLYLEGSIAVPKTADALPKFEQEVRSAKESGMQILRTVCSSGRRYETYHSAEAFRELQKTALASLQLAEPVLKKHQVKLGVENHKDWRAPQLAAMLKQISSEWIGATVDFGNNISLLEDPMEVVQTLAPYAVSTHIKDMAVEEYPDGFLLSEVPLGTGILDLPKMVDICRQKNPNITFSLEMITRDPLEIPCLKKEYWETFGDVPGVDLAETLRMVRQHKPKTPLPRVAQLDGEKKLATEEDNILACISYSKDKLGLK
ncbi:sugar phosphate isomerase/epimerase [Spirosoma sp. BT702]|uniref:Sugar phosphate isomerase/epimerase n=1 Tax=Spirosoma profusum TaxID=2771354 RepID=A0A927AUI6_9BACT|nr:TIM barrel protein [Spirosoma profusum]MBD2704502.1 sugar phosphate isomerase/epimerase [Spirosoma profusum]